MTTEHLITFLDLIGTFVFALSGAEAARESKLDLFGIIIIAFLTACGGGIVRDLCLDVTPPVGISHWPYLVLTIIAAALVIGFGKTIERLKFPVLLFDAIGLSIFSVAGTQKSLALGFNYEVAIILGVLSAIGGGMLRDIILKRIPVVLRKEIYGSAALVGAIMLSLSHFFEIDPNIGTWLGAIVCFVIRYLSLRRKWDLPSFSSGKME
jgi:uncharacterized membrane protein YeiH